MATFMVNKKDIEKKWYVIDAEGKILGRLASEIAKILRGKHKPIFTPHLDTGDFVVVVNADKIKVTGKKLEQKLYRSHSGYPGGFKEKSLKTMLERKPTEVLRSAVWGMLPKGRLGRKILSNLKVYSGKEHPHSSQQCKELDLKVSLRASKE